MLEGLYSAAAGMTAQQQRIDVIGNDLANVSTAGYKKARANFRDLAYVAERTGNGVQAGAGSAMTMASKSQAAGAMEQTGQNLDVAIIGDGFIQVRRSDGTTGLTRQGALRMAEDGNIVTAHGDRLQPPVRIPKDVDPSKVVIGEDGSVTGGGRALGKITLMDVQAPTGLMDVGGSVSIATPASGNLRPAAGTKLQSGALEMSNVQVSESMTDLVEAQRAFSLASKALQNQDQMMEIANSVKR